MWWFVYQYLVSFSGSKYVEAENILLLHVNLVLFKLSAPHQVLHCFLTCVIDISFCVLYQLHANFDISRLGFAFVMIIFCLTNNAECFAPCSATLRRMLQVVCLIFVYFVCVWCGVLRTLRIMLQVRVWVPGVRSCEMVRSILL